MDRLKDTLLGTLGIAGVAMSELVEICKDFGPLVDFVVKVGGLVVVVITIVLLSRRTKKVNQDIRINDTILKHPERDESKFD